MAGQNRPDPSEMFAQLMRALLGGQDPGEATQDIWRRATDAARPTAEPSKVEQRENLAFALATRAVEALEDLSLNVAAIRQRLERTGSRIETVHINSPREDGERPDGLWND